MRKETGMGEKAKASLARNRSSKSIKPHKAGMLTCLRCRVTLWTLTMPWRTLIYHSTTYKCLGRHCGNKNSKLRFQRTRCLIKEWTANSNHIRLTCFTRKEEKRMSGILASFCLRCVCLGKHAFGKSFLRAQSALCSDTIC